MEAACRENFPRHVGKPVDCLHENLLDFTFEYPVRIASPERRYLIYLHPLHDFTHVLPCIAADLL